MECEDHDPFNHDRNFDVESVKKEVKRGRKLVSINDSVTQMNKLLVMLSKESLFD